MTIKTLSDLSLHSFLALYAGFSSSSEGTITFLEKINF